MKMKLLANTVSVTVIIDGKLKRCNRPSQIVDHVATVLVRSGKELGESIKFGVFAAKMAKSLVTGQSIELIG